MHIKDDLPMLVLCSVQTLHGYRSSYCVFSDYYKTNFIATVVSTQLPHILSRGLVLITCHPQENFL